MAKDKQFEQIPDGLAVWAPAKINLTLLIAGKRPDGFHELETVMAKIDLYDRLTFTPSSEPGITLKCCGRYEVPPGDDNLVLRAARLFCKKTGIDPSVTIAIEKSIPIGAGLGGGSSDAAAAIMGLDRYFKTALKKEELMDIGAQIGSDVAFFMGPKMALCTGKGEKLRKIPQNIDFAGLLVLPNVNVSTKKVYENYRHNADIFNQLARKKPDLITKKNIDFTSKICANMLECSCFELYPELETIKNTLQALEIGRFCLSGSGSAMYCLADGSDKQLKKYQSMAVEAVGCECIIIHNNRW